MLWKTTKPDTPEEEQKQNYEEILAWANDYDFLTDDEKPISLI